MGELTTSIAHEINQPLMAIVLNGDATLGWLAAQPPNLVEARQAVTRVISEGTRAGEIIKRIREFSRKAAPDKIMMRVESLVEETLNLMRRQLERYGVSAETRLPKGLPGVVGDRVQLQQVLVNLLVNAMEAMATCETTRRRLEISAEAAGDDVVIVSVSDTGPGLAPEDSNRVFDAFFTTKKHGLGMGLSISRTIIESHGGRLWSEARQRGASFRFSLPAEGEGHAVQ
jgi:C4-dicarboxylate-specific signal transduction histidine kinase